MARWLLAAALVAVGLATIWLSDSVPPPLTPGSPAPGFALPALEGPDPVTLDGLRDRVVLVNFWATWCKPCEDEMPAMERLYQSFAGRPFELLAISVDEDPAEVAAFRERLGITFPILLDPAQDVSRSYQTTGFPETVLVDADGRVVERYVGPKEWDSPAYVERIRELVAAAAR